METQEYKSSLDDIEAGDMVVWKCRNVFVDYRLVPVKRTTRTQIVIGQENSIYEWKFRRTDGVQIASLSSVSDRIYAPLQDVFGITALELMAKDKAERAAKARWHELRTAMNNMLGRASLEQLEAIAKILEVEV